MQFACSDGLRHPWTFETQRHEPAVLLWPSLDQSTNNWTSQYYCKWHIRSLTRHGTAVFRFTWHATILWLSVQRP